MLGKQIYFNRVFHVIPLSHIGFRGFLIHGVIKLHGDLRGMSQQCQVANTPGLNGGTPFVRLRLDLKNIAHCRCSKSSNTIVACQKGINKQS